MKRVTFTDPRDLNEAKQKKEELEEGIRDIQTQLGTRKVSEFESEEKYNDWRNKAKIAMNYKFKEKKFIANWIDKKRQSVLDIKYGAKTLETEQGVICALLGLLEDLGREIDLQLSEEESALILSASKMVGIVK